MDKTLVASRYEIEKKLATGGMGEIFLARQLGDFGFQRKVVIKRLHEELCSETVHRDFFIQEAVISGKFDHPNIIHVYDVGADEQGLFMIMEYILGRDLMSIVRQSIKLKSFIPLEHALNIIAQIGEGLDYVHSLKDDSGDSLHLVHRDVTPSNIIVTLEGTAKLVDFGVAAVSGEDLSPGDGIIPGKMNYMAPELIEGHKPDKRADIFSLGVMFYELAVGRRLFKGSPDEVSRIILNSPVPLPTAAKNDMDPELELIILKCLEKDPDYRYSSARELVSDIESYCLKNKISLGKYALSRYIKELFRISPVKEVEQPEDDFDLDESFWDDFQDDHLVVAVIPPDFGDDLDDETYFEIMGNPDKAQEFFKSIKKSTPAPETVENEEEVELGEPENIKNHEVMKTEQSVNDDGKTNPVTWVLLALSVIFAATTIWLLFNR
ncbi:MAG: serine/threonine protein kinase [Deltaproteobacteria bacterium]|nr:serine/threonine protein kinase [Deltaproteobacteria bacterium]